MGFSLEMFISGLYEVLDNKSLSDEEKLKELQRAIEAGESYAKDCGKL